MRFLTEARPQTNQLYHVHGIRKPVFMPDIDLEPYWRLNVPGFKAAPGVPGVFTFTHGLHQRFPGTTAFEGPYHFYPFHSIFRKPGDIPDPTEFGGIVKPSFVVPLELDRETGQIFNPEERRKEQQEREKLEQETQEKQEINQEEQASEQKQQNPIKEQQRPKQERKMSKERQKTPKQEHQTIKKIQKRRQKQEQQKQKILRRRLRY